ncbi:hypothetical protein [Oryzihumus sp.]
MRKDEDPDDWTSSIGLNRRRFVQRAALLGGAFVWATPVVQSVAGPALAAGTKPNDISYLAVLLRNGGTWYRMKWNTTSTGALMLQTGSTFAVPGASSTLQPPDGSAVAPGAPPGTGAAYEANGSITLTLGSGTALVTFVVKRGLCAAGPGVAGEPSAGQTGGTVHFPGPTSNKASCA